MRSTKDNRSDVDTAHFERFVHRTEPRLRRALMAAFGSDAGREATAEALAWAWAHRDRLGAVSYLYRVGQSRSRRPRARPWQPQRPPDWSEPWIEPELSAGLAALSERQRVAVVLVHGYAWTHPEVGKLLGIRATTVQTHLDRGMARLRTHLKVDVQ